MTSYHIFVIKTVELLNRCIYPGDERVAYDFAENDVFQSPDVIPDGMTIDVNGNLWVAVIGSGKVRLQMNRRRGTLNVRGENKST